MNIKISIVLPVYNGEEFLSESIESVINQTFQEWELIIVDDSSTDNSLEIANKYQKSDSRITVYSNKENFKLPKSLNIGFRKAKGKYFTWTSDDNIYAPTALQEMYDYLESNNEYGMVVADYIQIDENNKIINKIRALEKDIRYCSSLGACFLYRASIKDDVGEYDENMFLAEDYDYWLRIYQKYKIGKIEKILYSYRVSENSLTISRVREIRNQFYRLRCKYWGLIFDNITPNMLTNLFLDMYYYAEDKEQFIDFFVSKDMDLKYVDIIKRENKIDENKKYIIFGCGTVCKKIVPILSLDKIEYFADNGLDKIGKYIYGKKIISFDEVKKISEEYNVVLAIHAMYGLGEVIEQFEKSGIKNYFIYDKIL